MDILCLWIGRVVVAVAGITAVVFLLVCAMDYWFRSLGASKEFVAFVRSRMKRSE